jgi:N-acetylmuramoyl-L-alanine amidase
VYLDLPRRVQVAREKGADVFVSVHLNAAPNRNARGVEIFFVSPSGAKRSARQVLANPGRAANDYGLSRKDSDVLHMIVDLNQQTVLERSEALAESILQSMSTRDMPPTRAVKQKSFAVLRNISMPSVLVEAGFISNKIDANFVKTEAGRNRIAETMSRGIVRYLKANPPQRIEGESLIVHRVRKGDTLWKISRTYKTSVTSIRTTNKLNSNVLRVGQELLVSRGY